jgi:hypothetical protein
MVSDATGHTLALSRQKASYSALARSDRNGWKDCLVMASSPPLRARPTPDYLEWPEGFGQGLLAVHSQAKVSVLHGPKTHGC